MIEGCPMRQIVLPGTQKGRETSALDAKTSHYLISVRRMRVGDSFDAIDETGARFKCTLLSDEPRGAKVSLVAVALCTASGDAQPRIALVQALPKGTKFDLIVRQAVELGVELIVPLITQHCVGLDTPSRTVSKLERRRRIIREALQQSGSPIHTEIVEAERLETLDAQLTAKGFDRESAVRILFHEAEQKTPQPLHRLLSTEKNRIVVAIGPEGGLSEDDCAAFTQMGFALYHAEGPVLRVETAAIFAVSVVRAISLERAIWKV
jgi:16S rRNA (uracil1498-N3)-methyltransferase